MQNPRVAPAALPAVAFVLVAAAAAAAPAAAQTGTGGAQDMAQPWAATTPPPLRLDPEFPALPSGAEVLRLENGLRVILLPNPAQPMVGIYTQVRVGSAYEDFRTSGMSHMLEHLLFNGTTELTQEQLYDLADLNGAYNNATTSAFFTNFMMVLPSDRVETGMRIQSQMLFHSTIPAEKFAKEQGIVLGELVQARDRDTDFADEVLQEVLYEGSSRALPTLGTRSTLENLKRDDVWRFYRGFYVPNNMVTTVAGGFDRERVLAALEKHYGRVAPGPSPAGPPAPPAFLDRTRSVVRRGGERPVVMLAFDAPTYQSPDYFAYLVLTRMLEAPGNGILTRALDQVPAAQRPDLAVSWERADQYGRLVLRFDLKPGDDPSRWYRLVQEACASALEWGITDEEVLELVHAEETQTLIDREQLRMLSVTAAEPIVLGSPDFYVSYLDRLRRVDAIQVVDALNTWLAESPCLAVSVLPAAGGAGPDQAAGAARPVVKRSVLHSGAVLVTQQTPGSPVFAVHLTARNRALIDGERPGAVNMVHRLLLSGVGGCDAACLQRRLNRLGAVVKVTDDPRIPMDNYYTNGRFSFVRLETAAEYGPDALALLADLAQNAAFTADDLERERAAQLAQLARQQGSAGATANRRLDALLFGAHPLARPVEGDQASLKALAYDEVRRAYQRAFAPENLIVAVASPYAHDELARTLDGLLAGRGRPDGGLPPLPATTEAQRVTVPMGGEMAALRLGALLRVPPEDRRAVELLVAVMSNRMQMDLRETKGLSYSVGVGWEPFGDEGQLSAWLNPPRERRDEGEQALRAFLAAFDPATITQDELARTRSAVAGRVMMRRLASISQAYYLAMAELEGDVAQYEKTLRAYDAVTLTDLRRAWTRHLKDAPLVTVVVE